MPPTPVGPMTSTSVPLVFDTDAVGFGGPGDMVGPVVGSVRYAQSNSSELELGISVDFGRPSTTYEIFLTCGPAHDLGCGWILIGSLVTDGVGSGSTTILVALGMLLTAPFGPGYRTDHVDLVAVPGDPSGSVLTAGALNYFVCRREEVVIEERHEGRTGEGDPLG
jgi:hypothetical protein